MGTIVCKKCDKIISPILSEKSEIIYSICDECSTPSKVEKK
ncbi:MAG: GapA-binding peptide SR1P [Vulcanibacillus sp.]